MREEHRNSLNDCAWGQQRERYSAPAVLSHPPKTAARGTNKIPIGPSSEISTSTTASKNRHFLSRVGSASRSRHASNARCHWSVAAFALISSVLGRARYKKPARSRVDKVIVENRDERNTFTGSAWKVIAHKFITSGAIEKGKIKVTSAASRATVCK